MRLPFTAQFKGAYMAIRMGGHLYEQTDQGLHFLDGQPANIREFPLWVRYLMILESVL